MNNTAILMFHGFGGANYEIEPLQRFLTDKGYDVVAPVLPGHGMTKAEMAKVKCKDWTDLAATEYKKLLASHGSVIIIGFSMGGLIAATIAKEVSPKAMIFVNTPIYLYSIKNISANIWGGKLKTYIKNISSQSSKSLVEFMTLLGDTKPLFKNITCPCLICQTRDDDTVRTRSAKYIAKNVKKPLTVFYPDGGHHALCSEDNKQLFEDVYEFIKRADL